MKSDRDLQLIASEVHAYWNNDNTLTDAVQTLKDLELDGVLEGLEQASEVVANEFLSRSSATTGLPSIAPTAMQVNIALQKHIISKWRKSK